LVYGREGERVKRIVEGYENYFNFIYGKKIESKRKKNIIEWVDIKREKRMIIFKIEKEKMEIEIESIRYRLIDVLLDEGFLDILGHEVAFVLRKENLHRFFELLEEIKYF
jgi:hypothetical protein